MRLVEVSAVDWNIFRKSRYVEALLGPHVVVHVRAFHVCVTEDHAHSRGVGALLQYCAHDVRVAAVGHP